MIQHGMGEKQEAETTRIAKMRSKNMEERGA